MKRALATLAALLPAACGSSASTPAAPADAGGEVMEDAAPIDLRGARYCEILVGKLEGEVIKVAVYNTIGLNDCPEAEWAKQDVAAIKADQRADVVILNGPRYWLVSSLAGSKLLDTAVVTFGGLAMRRAGGIDVPVATAMEMQKPYVLRTIQRDSVATFYRGTRQYEILDGSGHAYTMQSYSVQKEPQTEASLASLGERLVLPVGWSFRTRVLDAELVARAVDGQAIVTTDEYGNTYLRTK